MANPARNEKAYKLYKAALLATNTPCWKCGERATSPDHDPPLTHHTHIRGSGCCQLRPACLTCQRSQGGKMTTGSRTTGYDWPA